MDVAGVDAASACDEREWVEMAVAVVDEGGYAVGLSVTPSIAGIDNRCHRHSRMHLPVREAKGFS